MIPILMKSVSEKARHCRLQTVRERALSALASAIMRNPRAALTGTLILFVACAALAATSLRFESSRHAIVNPQDPEQIRLDALAERFGAVNDLVIVLSGAQPARLRAAADDLAPRLRAVATVSEVFYKVDAELLGSHTIWYLGAPALDQLRQGLALIEAEEVRVEGVVGALQKANEGIEAFLEGEADFEAEAAPQAEQVEGLAKLFDELRAWLEQPERSRFAVEQRDVKPPKTIGMDGHGYLMGDEGELLLIRISSETDLIDGAHAGPIVAGLREVLAGLPKEVTWGLTGVPAMVVEEQEAMQRDLPVTGSISVVLCLLIFLTAYRSLKSTIIVMLPLGLGMAFALGMTVLTVGHLNLLTNAMAVILVGMGIDFGIHLLTRIRHEQAEGHGPEDSVRRAMTLTGPAIIAGAITSSAAFATLILTDFRALEELGLIASLGLLSMLAATFLALPLRLGRPGVALGNLHTGGWRVHIKRRVALPILAAAALLTVWLGTRIEPIEFELDLAIMLPEDTMSRRTLEDLRRRGAGAFEYAVMQPADLAQLAERAEQVKRLPEDLVDRVESVLDVLPPELPATGRALARLRAAKPPKLAFLDAKPDGPAFIEALTELSEALAEDLPFELRRAGQKDLATQLTPVSAAAKRLLAKAKAMPRATLEAGLARFQSRARALLDRLLPALHAAHTPLSPAALPRELTSPWYRQGPEGERLALRIYPAGDPADARFSARFTEALRTIDPETTGYAVTYGHFGVLMQQGFRKAAMWSALVVFLLVLIDLRSLRHALLALLPLAVGGVWMVGLMNVLGVDVSFANAVSIPLIIGIGIDSGLHVIHRWRETGGDVDEAVNSTGRAILVSSLTTAAAFGALLFAAHAGAASLGLTLLIGVACCGLSALVVLPCTLTLLERPGPEAGT